MVYIINRLWILKFTLQKYLAGDKEKQKINISNISNYLGDVDITSLVNFSLLKNFFKKQLKGQ